MTDPLVHIDTSHGRFTIQLDTAAAPLTVANFLAYVDSGHYAGTIFHRVIDNFMVQGGGYDQALNKKPVQAPVKNEATNGRKNTLGTVAMARTSDPHSATAQFFVNVADSSFLDHRAPSGNDWGYCVFGEVVDGMDVITAIKALKTGPRGHFNKDCPIEEVVIKSASRA